MPIYFLLFAGIAILSLGITAVLRKMALHYNIVDQPNVRKVHKQPMPKMGGVAIFFAFSFGLIVHAIWGEFWGFTLPLTINLSGFICSSFIITLVGFIDDVYALNPWQKLLGQWAAATTAWLLGVQIETATLLQGIEFNWFWSYLLTVSWLVFICNAFNLMDGLDGLAGGVAFITLCTIIFISYSMDKPSMMIVAGLLASAVLGFLFFNIHPAKIFLGDTGSLFLGFAIALIAIEGFFVSTTAVTVVAPFLLLGLPIVDVSIVILRRMRNGQIDANSSFAQKVVSLIRTIFRADQNHLHHKFVELGLSHNHAVFSMYAIAILFSCLGITSVFITNKSLFYILGTSFIVLFIGLRKFGYVKINHNKQQFFSQSVQPHSFFQGLADVAILILAFSIAFVLRYDFYKLPFEKAMFNSALVQVVFVKMFVLLASGLYTLKWRVAKDIDALKVMLYALVASAVIGILYVSGLLTSELSVSVLILDFMLSLLFMLIARISLSVAEKRIHRHNFQQENQNALIYYNGVSAIALFKARNFLKSLGFQPVGFIVTNQELHSPIKDLPSYVINDELENICESKQITALLFLFADESDEAKYALPFLKTYRLRFDSYSQNNDAPVIPKK